MLDKLYSKTALIFVCFSCSFIILSLSAFQLCNSTMRLLTVSARSGGVPPPSFRQTLRLCNTPTTGTNIFRLFPSFHRGTEFPEFLWGLMQTLPSLILTHVIIGYDHRPYRRGASGFHDLGNRDACVPLLSCLSKCRNPKGTNSLSYLTMPRIKTWHPTFRSFAYQVFVVEEDEGFMPSVFGCRNTDNQIYMR
jgi:hypothetical protein